MKFLIKVGVFVLVLAIVGVAYAEVVMKEECKTRYDSLKKAQSDAQRNYMNALKSIRTRFGTIDSQEEAKNWEEQNQRLSDDYNKKFEDMKQEMKSLYNDPNCWEKK